MVTTTIIPAVTVVQRAELSCECELKRHIWSAVSTAPQTLPYMTIVMYSGTPLKRTPLGPGFLSVIARCPYIAQGVLGAHVRDLMCACS